MWIHNTPIWNYRFYNNFTTIIASDDIESHQKYNNKQSFVYIVITKNKAFHIHISKLVYQN